MLAYNTQQRQMLLDFLNKHIDESISAAQIISALRSNGISESAVYRNLAALEEDGEIIKISKPGERKSVYRANNEKCRNHFHLFCVSCKKTTHVSEDASKRLESSLNDCDGFLVDKDETMIYGICKDCRGRK
ncbi:MAG TPA: hypothetical protein DCO86_04890 [Spirochaetaceae bacterium]|nr:hypothetical protein [Spirochaetaceae bacterium]